MAQRYWPGQDPIGQRLRWGMPETATPWMTVVGEVDDVKVGSPDEETTLQVTNRQRSLWPRKASLQPLSATSGWLVLRSRISPEQMENTLRAAVQKIGPKLPLHQMRTMEQAISESSASMPSSHSP